MEQTLQLSEDASTATIMNGTAFESNMEVQSTSTIPTQSLGLSFDSSSSNDSTMGINPSSSTSIETNTIPPESRITVVRDFDVLLGRGKLYEKHVGNMNFIGLVKSNVDRYFNAISSDEKYRITMDIVDSITKESEGRFLRRGNRYWISVDHLESRKKVAQAIQYQRRKMDDKEQPKLLPQDGDQLLDVPSPPVLHRHQHYVTPLSPENMKKRCASNNNRKTIKKEKPSLTEILRLIRINNKNADESIVNPIPSALSILNDSTSVRIAAKALILKCGTPQFHGMTTIHASTSDEEKASSTTFDEALAQSENQFISDVYDATNNRNSSLNALSDASLLSTASCDLSDLLTMPILDNEMNTDYDDCNDNTDLIDKLGSFE